MSDSKEFASELVRLGARCVFGIPGEGVSLDIVDTFARFGLPTYWVPHESAAALMAGGYGRVSGSPGVSLSIKGPGLSNMLGGIASNWLDRHPAISVSESYSTGAPPYRMHKRLAHKAMVSSVVKAYADNPKVCTLPQLWNLALAEEPGPVHIDISAQLSGEVCLGVPADNAKPLSANPILHRIAGSKRPVIIAGALATRRSWGEKLARLNVPVFTTVAGKGACDEMAPCSAGIFTNVGGVHTLEHNLLPRADLVVGLGLRTTEILDVKPLPVPLVIADELASRANGLGSAVEAQVEPSSINEILQSLDDKAWGLEELMLASRHLDDQLKFSEWLPAGVLKFTQSRLPRESVFLLDTGSFCVIGEHVLKARHRYGVLGSAQGRSMGVAIPMGIGASLGSPGTPVVVVVGDGGIGMYAHSVSLAVRENLPLLVLLMADGHYSSVRQSAEAKKIAVDRLRLDPIRWELVFQAMGCASVTVESMVGLEDALATWGEARGPLFVEARFDPARYLTMTRGIR